MYRLINNKIYLSRGETPTYDVDVLDRYSGIPFMVGTRFKNPKVCFSVSSNVFDAKNRTIFKLYLDVKDIHRFDSDEVVEYPDLNWNSDLGPAPGDELLLHYIKRPDDKYEYAYWNGTDWVLYSFRLTFQLPHEITAVLEPKTYKYEISLLGYREDNPNEIEYKEMILDPSDFIVEGSSSE